MIVVAGESLVDLIAGEDGSLMPLPGGGPFNVARTLARLEVPVAFLGAVSTDSFGRVLRAALAEDGVDLRCVVDTDRPTTLAVAELDDEGIARYRFYAEGTAAPSLTPTACDAVLSAVDMKALHVGSLGLALEPLGSAVEQAVAHAASDVLVMVDPNWRPGAVADGAAWRARLERVLRRADVVKVSTEDLAHLAPGIEVARAARGLLAGRARCVLVTAGGGPVRVLTTEGEAVVEPEPADVVDTVGAGDAFCAGFLAWCTASQVSRAQLGAVEPMRDAAAFAALIAARTCERAGADPPRLDELEALAGRAAVGA
jgi:fructokinase